MHMNCNVRTGFYLYSILFFYNENEVHFGSCFMIMQTLFHNLMFFGCEKCI